MLHRISQILLCSASIAMCVCSYANSAPPDPLEKYNRGVFNFNKAADEAVTKPIAYMYFAYLPQPIQFGIGNFFDNLREIPNVANDLLQGKIALAMHDTSRFLINSTIGILGIFDPAASLGLEHRKEDFGQTLYHWGYKNSSYLILPLLGPSSVRDTIGLGMDYFALTIWPWIDSDWKYVMLGADYIDIRARLLRRQPVFDAVAMDEYTFTRDAYFQYREYLFKDDNKMNTDEDNKTTNDTDPADQDKIFEKK